MKKMLGEIILEKNRFYCDICGERVHTDKDKSRTSFAILSKILPECMGGKNNVDNLRVLCSNCHQKRGYNIGKKRITILKSKLEASRLNTDKKDLFLKDDFKNGFITTLDIENLIETYTDHYNKSIKVLKELLED